VQPERLVLVFVISVVCTYLSRIIALKFGILDAPNSLKIHKTSQPRFGGFGIFAALCVGIIMLPSSYHRVLAGAIVMWLVGVIDDRWTIGSLQKLAGQCLAGAILGYSLFELGPSWVGLTYGVLGFLLAVVFANAVNLIDGMDGLAGGNSFLIFVGLGLMEIFHGGDWHVSFVTAAAILGFLPFNFPRARLFMGDSGSLVIGYFIAYTLVMLLIASPTLFVCGLIISIVPTFDLTLGVIRRLIHGKPIFAADRGHFYDRLNESTHNSARTVLITYACTMTLNIVAIFLSFTSLAVATSGLLLISLLLLLISRSMGWFQTEAELGRI